MLTKVIIILGLLIVFFGFGDKKSATSRNKMTNFLLMVVAGLLVLLILTSVFK